MKTLVALLLIFLSASPTFAQEPVWSKKYHTGSVTCLDFSGDAKMLASGSKDSILQLWNVEIGDTLRTFRKFNTAVFGIDFSSESSFLVASTNEWDKSDGLNLHYVIDTFGSIKSKIKSDGYTISTSGSVKLIVSSWLSFSQVYLFAQDKKALVLMSGKYQYLIAGSENTGYDGRIDIWNLDSQRVEKTLSLSAGDFYSVAFSPDKRYLACASLYSLYSLFEHRNNPKSELYFKNYIFDTEANVFLNIPTGVAKLNFTSDSKKIIIADRNGSIYSRTISDLKIIEEISQETAATSVLAADFKNRYYISTHADSTLRLWTPGIPNIFKRILLKSPVTTIAVSPDSVHFATAHTDGTVALWNIDSLALKAVTDSVFTPKIDSVSPNQILCTDADAELTVSARSNFGEGLSYQWQKGGVEIMESDSVSGVTSPTLLLKNIDKSDAGSYSVVVRSLKNSNITSPPAVLSVRDVPVVTVQPITKTELYKGEKIVLKITLADTAGAQYQWFKNGEPIAGAVSAAYTVTADSGSVAGGYTVRITNQCGSVVSDEAEIVVLTTDITEENPFKTTTLSTEPNPFKNSTTIRFSLEKPLKIKLAVTDALGREVAVLKDGLVEIGEQKIVFKNDALPQGTYYITLSGEGLLQTIMVKILR